VLPTPGANRYFLILLTYFLAKYRDRLNRGHRFRRDGLIY